MHDTPFFPWTHFIEAKDYVHGLSTVNTAATLNAVFATGNPVLLQVDGSTVGMQFTTTNGQFVFTKVKLPFWYDNRHRLFVRHWWSSVSAASTETVQWRTVWSTQNEGSVALSWQSGQTFTRAIPVATKSGTAAHSISTTPWGVIGNPGAAPFFQPDSQFVNLLTSLASSSVSPGVVPVFLIGTELAYTPKLYFGDGGSEEARLPAINLDRVEETTNDV